MTDNKAPHKAVLNISIEVHEVDKYGNCSAKIVTSKELAEYGIKPKMIIAVDGFSKEECLKNLRNRLSGTNN